MAIQCVYVTSVWLTVD